MNNSKGYQNSKWKNGQPDQNSYVGAPYNFIDFYDKVYEYPQGKLPAHNSVKEELITGEITYEVTAKTPIMIDDGNGEFFSNANGQYRIPGSTIRGLIRNNVQVLGLCSYEDDIDDYALMYRNVARGAEKTRYNNALGSEQMQNGKYKFSVLKNVRAGYVVNEGGKYVIYQTAVDKVKKELGDMNYYVLSERKIIGDYLKYGEKFAYGFFRQGGKNILQHEFKKFEPKKQDGRMHYKGTSNKKYSPYYDEPVSYKVAHEKDIVAVGGPEAYEKKGYAVSTGRMNEKKAVYIIPKIDKQKDRITIPDKDVKAFKTDLKKRENTLKHFGGRDYFDLPQEGKMRPVFYIQLGDRLYFGFTPRLRLFYDHTVKDGLKPRYKAGGVDYARALFGYTSQDKGYRSRLSFSDAVLVGTSQEGDEKKLILAEPKPTSYLDYLKQNKGGTVTYNTSGFELRGAKQYWLHKSLAPEDSDTGKSVESTIKPLKVGTKFTGKIRFRNLTEDELGLVLWAVRLNEGSQMNVGKAKAYGYGRIEVTVKTAQKIDMQKAYRTEGELCLNPYEDIDVVNIIESYKRTINQHLDKMTIDELPHIKDFFIMKNSGNIPENGKTRYMKIQNENKENGNKKNEYQDRGERALPTIKDVVGKDSADKGKS